MRDSTPTIKKAAQYAGDLLKAVNYSPLKQRASKATA